MKEKVGKFVKAYGMSAILGISLLFMLIYNSMIPLIIYSITIHILLLMLIILLYEDNLIINETHIITYKHILQKTLEALIIIIILAILKHWYTLCISCFCIFLTFIHIVDIKKKESKKLIGESN